MLTDRSRQTATLSVAIDKELREAADTSHRQVDLLVLGDQDLSGRWEFLKRLEGRYGLPLGEDDLLVHTESIRSNLIDTMRSLCMLVQKLGLEDQLALESVKIDSEGSMERRTMKECFDLLIVCHAGPPPHCEAASKFLAMWDCIQILWKSTTIQHVLSVSAGEIDRLPHRFIFNNIHRIASPSFRPTVEDIACGACPKLSDMMKDEYRLRDGSEFNFHYATRHKAERQRWIRSFNHMDCVVVVVDLSSYDESKVKTNGCTRSRLAESFDLIDSICTQRAFVSKPVMLILNKVDLFAKKIQYCNIVDQESFKDYKGPPRHAKRGCRYFVQKFKYHLAKHNVNDLFIHAAHAAATQDAMRFIVDSVWTIKMTKMLRSSGFLGFEIESSPFLLEDISFDKNKRRRKRSRAKRMHAGNRKTSSVRRVLTELLFVCV